MKKAAIWMTAGVLPFIIILLSVPAWGSDYELGKQIYEGKCLFCHGSNGTGNGPAAASLNPKPDDFNDPQFWKKNDEKKISETIEKGHGMMPAFDMKPDEIKAVIDYISHSFKR
jgi:mono/diheme cytochrome c family protein